MNAPCSQVCAGRPGAAWRGVIEAVPGADPGQCRSARSVTLREGGTPLLPAPALSARTGCEV